MKLNLAGVTTATAVRGVITVIVALNILLTQLGWNPIVMSESDTGELVNGLIVFVTALIWMWGWWKNNSLTANAQAADDLLRNMDEG